MWRPAQHQPIPITDFIHNGHDMTAKGYINIPGIDASISADGKVMLNQQVVDYIGFKEEWLSSFLGVSAQNLVLISVKGDSMDPTLSEGDLVLIDTAAKRVEANAIYAVAFWGSFQIKRVQLKINGTMVIKSDNNIYEPEIIPNEESEKLHVVGRVVWYGKKS
jgi:phage repressor protein C with HTH and peptisase S24 domain